jgi:replicative DNA helicase
VSTEITTYVLDLDEDFLSHLAIPESWQIIQAESLKPELLEEPYVIRVYEWQRAHAREHGQPASASVLAEEFDLNFYPPEAAIGDLIERLQTRYLKNEGRQALEEIIKVHQSDPKTLPALLVKKGRDLVSIASQRGETFGTGDYDRSMYLYDKKVNLGPGASLAFPELDEWFFGQRGLTFLVAPPKSYKSWYLLCVLQANVMQGKTTTLYSLELPAHESDMRLRCLLADISWWKYLKNQFSHEDRQRIKEVSEYIDDAGVYTIKKPDEGQRSIDQLIDSARNLGSEVILIDQLQYVEVGGRSLGELNNTGSYFGVINHARNLSDDGPIMMAHQFNRQAMFADEMPDIRYAKGSSAIEEAATLALGLWGNHSMREAGFVQLGTLISRNYMYASWKLGVELSKGCSFEILGRAEEEDE